MYLRAFARKFFRAVSVPIAVIRSVMYTYVVKTTHRLPRFSKTYVYLFDTCIDNNHRNKDCVCKMSLHSTPILYLNMGGEMLYVLRQRLKAQKIDVDKTIQGKTTFKISNISKILNTYFTNVFVQII